MITHMLGKTNNCKILPHYSAKSQILTELKGMSAMEDVVDFNLHKVDEEHFEVVQKIEHVDETLQDGNF